MRHAFCRPPNSVLLPSTFLIDLNPQVRLVIEKAIENMRRIPHCCVDDFGMEGGVLVGDVSIERHAGIIAY